MKKSIFDITKSYEVVKNGTDDFTGIKFKTYNFLKILT